MSSQYKLIPARRAEWFQTPDGQEIYFEEAGPKDGVPVVFLHGGPGSGCKPSHRQFFDPKRYRSVLIDQRGSGKSKPFGGVENNTTDHLIADLEQLRELLEIEQWVLFGGSWGAALALAYAQTHPQRVTGIVLRGTFLARPYDVDWFFEHGANRLLPQAWSNFKRDLGPIPQAFSIQEHMYQSTFSDDEEQQDKVAKAWANWSESVVLYSFDKPPSEGESESLERIRAKTRIEVHYAKHGYFMSPNQLLDNIDRVPDVPVKIIHGQRDITCTPDAGWDVHQALPDSEFQLLRTAGHLSGERPMTEALVKAADDMLKRIAANA